MSVRHQVAKAAQARAGDAAAVGLALFIGGLAMDATDVASGGYSGVNDVIGLAAAGVLWWRRRAPLLVASLTFVAAALAPLAAGAAIVGVYALAGYRRGRAPAILVALYVTSALVATALFPDEHLGALGSILVGFLLTLAALGWGMATRTRRDLLSSLGDRAERAELEQQARVAEARRAERARIAAEMHDVLAHRLSMLSLHAGAIEYRPDAPPDDLVRSAAVIRSNAHLALEELRAVIGVLRDDDGAGLTPQPTVGDLDALVEECRSAGMRIDLERAIEEASLPRDLSLHAYRIVQEGLTNARKHAPRRPVRLSVTGRAGEGIVIDIVNETGPSADDLVPGAGVGLIGLRERVGLVGGSLQCGPDGPDIYRLRAWLPWPT